MPTATSTHTADDELNGSLVPASRLPNIPALPSVETVRAKLSEKSIPSDQIAEVIWLLNEGVRRGLTTFEAIGKMINRDGTVISRVMRGVYEASLAPLTAHIQHFRIVSEERKEIGDEIFVPTLSIVTRITGFCDLARIAQQIGMIWGKNQSGKTSALKHYAATHADTVYVKLPAGGGTNKCMAALAEAAGISSKKSDVELWERIRRRFTKKSLLIVDEFHQAVHAGRRVQTVTVDRLREIHDDCECGVVLCGTEHVQEAMKSPKLKEFLGQLDNRGALRLCLPSGPQPGDRSKGVLSDLEQLYEAYGLPLPSGDAAKIAKEISASNGIARLTDYFKIARRLAAKAGQTFSWDHFITTHATLKTWATGEGF